MNKKKYLYNNHSRKNFLKLSSIFLGSLSSSIFPEGTQQKSSNLKKVLIIGAGMAGSACAEKLFSSGYEVEILEARDRIGGRIYTNRELGVPIDIGAGWIHGTKNNPLVPLAKKYGARTRETDFDNVLILDKNKEVPPYLIEKSFNKFQEILGKIKESLVSSKSDKTIRDYLDLYYSKETLDTYEKKLFPYFERLLENDTALELNKVSAYGYFEMGEKIDGGDLLVYDGYDLIVKGLLSKVQVRLGEPVSLIRETSNRVEVETTKGKYYADFVVVTVPVSVLQKNSIRFEPVLPREKMEAIKKIPFGFFSKLVLEFPEKFWSSKEAFNQLDGISKQWYELIFNLNIYTGKPILAFLSTGDRGKFVEKEKEIVSMAKTELTSIFGSKVPNPTRTLKTNWSGDPYSNGTYTVSHKDMDSLIESYAKPFGKIFFAGEGTNEKYYSTVHGAYLSGVREANRILKI